MTFEVEYKVTLIRKGSFTRNYRKKYHNNSHPQFSNLPPFWIASEVITIGCLFKIFSATDFSYFKGLPAPHNTLLDTLANEFGANDFNSLTNWVQRLRDVRNRAAHHSRLWNAKLAIPSQIASELTIPAVHQYRPYLTVCVIHKMIKTLDLAGIDLRVIFFVFLLVAMRRNCIWLIPASRKVGKTILSGIKKRCQQTIDSLKRPRCGLFG
jgi:abortive infection bacteriophage resistance protein